MRGEHTSRTHTLCQTVLREFTARHPEYTVSEIDLTKNDIPPYTGADVTRRDDLRHSGTYTGTYFTHAHQFADADAVLIGAPYWDLSFPAALKAYLEHVSVCDVTFRYNEQGIPQGMCKGRTLFYLTTSGGPIGGFNLGYDYVKALYCGLFGIQSALCVTAENLDDITKDVSSILLNAEERIAKLVENCTNL